MSTPKRWFGIVGAATMLNPSISPTAKAVYGVLAVYADRSGACFPSYSRVAIALDVSRDSVKRAIRELEEHGVVVREARYVEGRQISNILILKDIEVLVGAPVDT